MNRSSLTLGFAIALLLTEVAIPASPNEQAEAVTIPLGKIWAYEMPETRDVRELELDAKEPDKATPLTSGILTTLTYNKPGQTAKPAFVVAGTGIDALREAAAVLVDGKKPRASFPASSDVSIVFFSNAFGYYVHVRKVEQEPGKIVVTYRFAPHRTKEMTNHFALIPLGKLPPGKVKVEFVRAPIDPQFAVAGFKEPDAKVDAQVIARPFEFEVAGSKK